jgi:hypothetical protein
MMRDDNTGGGSRRPARNVLGEPLYCLRRDFWAIEGRLAMGWSMDRQGIRTLFDRETKRLKQFELSGPRRKRISLDTYPDELAARDAEFRQEARYGKWSVPGPQSHGLRCKR